MNNVSNTKAAGRRAGLAYLVIILFSAPGYMILTKLLAGDSHAVLAHLATSQTLFTLALVSSVIGFLAWTVLAILLYRLMSSAGRISALLMVIFSVAGTVMNLIALAPLLPLLRLASSGMDAGTLAPIVQSYNRLLLLAQVFSGLWLFPFGLLVLRSRIAPRLPGFCLIIGGFSYLLTFATAFDPGLHHIRAYRTIGTTTGILGVIGGEFGICLWLLIKGARQPDLNRAVA